MTEQISTVQTEIPLSQEQRRQKFVELGWWVTIPLTVVPAHSLYNGEQRLDAGFYAADVVSALRMISESKYEIATVKQVSEPIYYPGRFKRIYAKDRSSGTPFLTASAMLHFRPTSEEFLANNTAAVKICEVKPGWLLVTRSGSVGRCVIVGKHLARFAITDDALRVRTKDIPIGYLYAFLSTWTGQTLIVKDQYGSAIKHLEPQHLETVPLPLLPKDEQQSTHNEITRAYNLRDEANDLLDQADEMLHRELGLPRFDPDLVAYLPLPPRPESNRPALPHPKAFSIKASGFVDRFDASYHVPITRTVTDLLGKGKYPVAQLSRCAKRVSIPLRFKRVYVSKNHGLPFLQPSQVPMIRPYDLTYISRCANARDAEECALKERQILITRSGTVGRVTYVTSRLRGWIGSDDLIRVELDMEKSNPGFLMAFLMTPYGNLQLTRGMYGSVINHLEEEHIQSVVVPNAPMELQTPIGKLVIDAFEKKDEATAIEEAAIRRLETLLQLKG